MRWLVPLASFVTACGAPAAPAGRTAPAPTRATPHEVPEPAVDQCGGARFLAVPPALDARGTSPVGARTLHVDGLTLEVWYPAPLGSTGPRVRYDLREAMPATEAAKIPDADNAWLDCDCVRDLPLDTEHGPYPVVVFLHGAASFRAQSAFLATHWASRGFVVVAPDLPGIGLDAALGGKSGFPLGTPLQVMNLLTSRSEALAFLRDHIQPSNVALVGHSLGALLLTTVDRPEVRARIAMAGATTSDTTLSLVGDHDQIAGSKVATGPRIVVHGAGHLAFSDLCLVGADRGGALAIARAHGVTVPPILASLALDGCRPTDAPFARTAPAIRAATSAVLEHAQRCAPDRLGELPAHYDVDGEQLDARRPPP